MSSPFSRAGAVYRLLAPLPLAPERVREDRLFIGEITLASLKQNAP
jgi:hypothetical protein